MRGASSSDTAQGNDINSSAFDVSAPAGVMPSTTSIWYSTTGPWRRQVQGVLSLDERYH